ncbi:type 1 glutamine amidotransferase [Jatrophihabitans sp. YIM 134969]
MSNSPRVLVVEPDAADPVARLGDWLRDSGAELQVVRPYAGDALPADLTGFDALIVMGGRMGAGDDAEFPWLADVRALLVAAVNGEVPTLGVCLGSQLLGLALGGTVERNPEGPEVGASLVAKRQAAAGDPLFRALPITPDVLQWHDDAVTRLPSGAELLMSSPGCATQAFRVGRVAWGVQFHIENTADMVREWTENSRHSATRSGRDLDAVEATALGLLEDIEETWRPFAGTFADIARDPASAHVARTVPSSTAEPISDKAAIRAALAAEADAARGIGVTPPDAPYGRPLPLAGDPRP